MACRGIVTDSRLYECSSASIRSVWGRERTIVRPWDCFKWRLELEESHYWEPLEYLKRVLIIFSSHFFSRITPFWQFCKTVEKNMLREEMKEKVNHWYHPLQHSKALWFYTHPFFSLEFPHFSSSLPLPPVCPLPPRGRQYYQPTTASSRVRKTKPPPSFFVVSPHIGPLPPLPLLSLLQSSCPCCRWYCLALAGFGRSTGGLPRTSALSCPHLPCFRAYDCPLELFGSSVIFFGISSMLLFGTLFTFLHSLGYLGLLLYTLLWFSSGHSDLLLFLFG